jgi:hypothetical protein
MIVFLLFLLLSLIAFVPLGVEFFTELWASPNHCFFPLGLGIAGWLAYVHRGRLLSVTLDERGETAQPHRVQGASVVAGVGMTLAIGIGLVSHAMHWPHVGWVSMLMLGCFVAYRQFGRPGMMSALPIAILLFFLKPLPSVVEPWFQLGMQSVTSRMASAILDFGRVFHYSSGVVIGLVGRDVLAEEVCNGVRSIVLVVFIAIAWGIFYQYHWFRTFLNVSQAIFWVVLWNAIRIAILLMNQDAGGGWIESPWVVAVVEYGVLFAMLFFTWSGDQFFASVVEPKASALPAGVEVLEAPPGSMQWWGGANRETMAWCLVLGLLAVLGFRWNGLYGAAEPISGGGGFVNPGEMLVGWKRGETESALQPRVAPLFLPKYLAPSQHWEMEKGGSSLQWYVHGESPNYPGPLWHWAWYGWSGTASEAVPMNAALEGSYVVTKLSRLPGEAGGAVSCGIDQRGLAVGGGEPFGAIDRMGVAMVASLQYVVGLKSFEETRGLLVHRPIRSVSLYRKSAKPLSEESEAELKKVFEAILVRWQGKETADETVATEADSALK